MKFTKITRVVSVLALILIAALACGCDVVSKKQMAEMKNQLGTYGGAATENRIMGAMMSGRWTVSFPLGDDGTLKCKCTLRLHDEFHGWGEPSTQIADIAWEKQSGNPNFVGRANASDFSSTIYVEVSPQTDQPVNSITLCDADFNDLTLTRK